MNVGCTENARRCQILFLDKGGAMASCSRGEEWVVDVVKVIALSCGLG